jgi:hypothetical protein
MSSDVHSTGRGRSTSCRVDATFCNLRSRNIHGSAFRRFYWGLRRNRNVPTSIASGAFPFFRSVHSVSAGVNRAARPRHRVPGSRANHATTYTAAPPISTPFVSLLRRTLTMRKKKRGPVRRNRAPRDWLKSIGEGVKILHRAPHISKTRFESLRSISRPIRRNRRPGNRLRSCALAVSSARYLAHFE